MEGNDPEPVPAPVDEITFAADVQARLLAADPLASEELCEHYLVPLSRGLRAKYRTTDPDFVHDAVVIALLDHAERPERFDPSRRSLRGYLTMAAERDLQNLRQHHRPRLERESVLDDVGLEAAARNRGVEAADAIGDDVADWDAADRLIERAMAVAQTKEERAVLRLMLAEERATEVFADALGLSSLPPPEQRDRVFAIKDRLTKRLRRNRIQWDRRGRGDRDA